MTIYNKNPSNNHELDLALDIYNYISNQDQTIDWKGFEIALEIYNIEDVILFWEYIGIIKQTIINFDKIYNDKINTDDLSFINNYIGKK